MPPSLNLAALAAVASALTLPPQRPPAPELRKVRCPRCGNLTIGQREGGVDYCTCCAGVLPEHLWRQQQ